MIYVCYLYKNHFLIIKMYLLKFLLKSKCSLQSLVLLLLIISFCVILHIYMMNDMTKFIVTYTSVFKLGSNNHKSEKYMTPSKYILLWQPYYLIDSREMTWTLKNLNCSISDCTLTKDRYLLNNLYRFDAIIFNEGILNSKTSRPDLRSYSQKYIFTTIESSYHHPSCELSDDNFFNWTFTYRLDSDIVWNYFIVQNSNNGAIIAPGINVEWTKNTDPVKPKIKQILLDKNKAAAWLVSNCNADSLRNEYMTKLQEHLFHFSLTIDIYGACSMGKCDYNDCEEMIKKDYYFYMAFENSFSEDYVTEKVLHGYNNYAVPIVYGGANYTRFLPPGSYINAREMHPYNLAYLIYKCMQNKPLYESFFRWTNVYTIRTSDTKKYHPLCRVCEALHDSNGCQDSAKKNFRIWWNGLNGMKWCLSNEYWSERNKLNVEGKDDFSLY